VPVENADNYVWTMQGQKSNMEMYKFLSQHGLIVITDRCKGLINAIEMQLANAFARFCARHILSNIKGGAMSKECQDIYWTAVKSETKKGFDEAMSKLNTLHPSAYKYLHAIPHALWANYAFPSLLTHEFYTNNLSERAFAWLGEELRGKPPVTMLKDMLSRLGEQHHQRHLQALFLKQNKV
jgi:transposase-like protein